MNGLTLRKKTSISHTSFRPSETIPEGDSAGLAGRVVKYEDVQWMNLGEPHAEVAHLKANVSMPNGEIATTEFDVPLLYTAEHTHCEIDPQLVLGVCASSSHTPSTTHTTCNRPVRRWSSNPWAFQAPTTACVRTPSPHLASNAPSPAPSDETTHFDDRPGGRISSWPSCPCTATTCKTLSS